MSQLTSATSDAVHTAVEQSGFTFVEGAAMRAILLPFGALTDWSRFAQSWNRLELDTYMADGGRYRRLAEGAGRRAFLGLVSCGG